jgi:serine O-acetyltransferase
MTQPTDPEIPPLAEVVEALCRGGRAFQPGPRGQLLPSRDTVVGMVEDLRAVLFPGYFGPAEPTAESRHFHVGAALDRVVRTLEEQVRRGLALASPEADVELRARTITATFLRALPEIRRLLDLDAQAAYEGDPAAQSPDEAIFCYPGILAVTNHRIAHALSKLGVPLLPRLVSEHAHSLTGIDIHPGAVIGERFFIDHGTGVVIGETCVIGDRVRLYQGVTLGAKSFPLDEEGHVAKGIPRHPIVEDDVVIYAGATILGRVTLGRGSTIGGNVWLTSSVPPGTRVSPAANRQEHFEGGGGI